MVTLEGLRAALHTGEVDAAMASWREDMTRDLGGDLSKGKETLLQIASRELALLNMVDEWLFQQRSLIYLDTPKNGPAVERLSPVLISRTSIADSLAKKLKELGLERKAQQVTDLKSYLNEKKEG